ncbi:MAG: AMP-binding protein [Verrucomicrobia bacterium]|nr:AMP-binding protein [Verrucomicrobiota bacterium]
MFGERWQKILHAQGDKVALWHPDGAVSYLELEKLAYELPAQTCPQLGSFYLARGDGLEITTALLAGFLTHLPVQVVEKDRQRRVPTSPSPAGTALIKQTVGSSGVRRCQFFSFDQIAADVDRLHSALGLAACDAALAPLSVAHSFGLTTTVLQTLLNGLPTHWLPTPFPTGMKEALAEKERAFLPGVPAMWKAWLIAGLDLSRVHLAVSAGSTLTHDLESRVRDSFGLKLHNLYGTSECGAISYDSDALPRCTASDLGTLLPGVSSHLGPDGRLLVQSDAVGLGYDETLTGELFAPPDHLTSDVIEIQGDRLHFQRCLGQGINVASRKLSPIEIAAKISASLGGLTAIVSGAPSRDPERVQDIICHVPIPAEALTPEFKAKICATLAPWEVPRRWTTLPSE